MTKFTLVAFIISLFVGASWAFAEESATTTTTTTEKSMGKMDKSENAKDTMMSKETREKMAKMHEDMATCLRSDKTMEDCHDQMHKDCMASMGKDMCTKDHMMSMMNKRHMHSKSKEKSE